MSTDPPFRFGEAFDPEATNAWPQWSRRFAKRSASLPTPMARAKFVRAKLVHTSLGVDPGTQSMGVLRTDATSADFTEADLTGANLRKVLFAWADLTGVELTDADVTGADFTGAILRGIRGRDRLHGLDQALHVDQAIFND